MTGRSMIPGSDCSERSTYGYNDEDDNADMTSPQLHDGGDSRAGSPTVTSGMMADDCSVPVATSCVGNLFHRRRRRTAFTSEQVSYIYINVALDRLCIIYTISCNLAVKEIA